MKLAAGLFSLLFINACSGKLDTKETGGSQPLTQDAAPVSAAPKAETKLETVALEVIAGTWSSECIPDPSSTIRPGIVAQYQFSANDEATLKIISYRDAACSSRYTKADVDKLRNKLQADAQAGGLPPLNENELKAYDVLWLPPTTQYKFKLGRKYNNKLMEIDLTAEGPSGPEATIYTTFYFDEGTMYFSKFCTAADALAARCTGVTGDQADRRGTTVDYSIGYEKSATPPAP